MTRHLIVDGSNLLHRILHVPQMRELRDSRGRFTGGMYGVIKNLKLSLDLHRINGNCLVVWDTGHSKRRLKIHSMYKARDEETPEFLDDGSKFWHSKVFAQSRASVNAALKLLGVKVVMLPHREADDIIARLCDILSSSDKIIISTEDKDFFQLISERVTVFRPILEEHMTFVLFRKKFGFEPKYWVIYRSIIGDSSDGIGGVRGAGMITAQKVVRKMKEPTLSAVMETCDLLQDDHRVAKVWGAPELLERNIKLIDLEREHFSGEEIATLKGLLLRETMCDPKAFLGWAKKFEMDSIVNFFTSWVEPFRRLTEAEYV